jgi:hypothetical protein
MQATTPTALADVLEKQIEVLEELANLESQLQRAVADRDWPEAERIIESLRRRAIGFSTLEENRHREYQALLASVGASASLPFSVALSRLDVGSRRNMTELYRRLKVALFRVRSISEGLDAFVAALVTTTRGILEELYPTRKGRMYSRGGKVAAPEDWALVVNTNL